MGVIEGNAPVTDNEWEAITRGGDQAIRKWIGEQLRGKSCTIVLISAHTSGRKWTNYEIEKSWNDGKGLLGIYIHHLQDRNGRQSSKGDNPFDGFTMKRDGKKSSGIVKAYDPPYFLSTDVHAYIKRKLAAWVEEAVSIRENY